MLSTALICRESSVRTRGAAAMPTTRVFSSRQIERATYDSLAFCYLACNRHPDHDTLAAFRRRFGAQFVQVLQIAHANRLGQFRV